MQPDSTMCGKKIKFWGHWPPKNSFQEGNQAEIRKNNSRTSQLIFTSNSSIDSNRQSRLSALLKNVLETILVEREGKSPIPKFSLPWSTQLRTQKNLVHGKIFPSRFQGSREGKTASKIQKIPPKLKFSILWSILACSSSINSAQN